MRTLLPLLLAAALAACATNGKFQAKMNSFIGQPEIALVGALGQPAGRYETADGAKVISFARSGQMVLPGAQTTTAVTSNTYGTVTMNQGVRQAAGNYSQTSTTYVPQQAPATTIALSCVVNFTLDSRGIVQSWTATGNHCVSD